MRHHLRQVHHVEAGKLVIRPARPNEDASALVELHRAVLEEGSFFVTESDELREGPEVRASSLHQLERSDNSVCMVAELDKVLVGMVVIQGGLLRRVRHTGKLEILVAEQARGKGVGSHLLQAVLDWATRHRTLTKLGLNVFSHNEQAIRLYEAHGFKREGYRAREYRLADGSYWDDVLMARSV